MWTEITRPKYERKGLGYSSDLSDPEWAMIEPRLPQRNRLGRPPRWSSALRAERAINNAAEGLAASGRFASLQQQLEISSSNTPLCAKRRNKRTSAIGGKLARQLSPLQPVRAI